MVNGSIKNVKPLKCILKALLHLFSITISSKLQWTMNAVYWQGIEKYFLVIVKEVYAISLIIRWKERKRLRAPKTTKRSS